MLRHRLASLLAGECTLLAYHLPLDAQAEIGNNAVIVDDLQAVKGDAFGEHAGIPIGRTGHFESPLAVEELIERCRNLFDHEVILCPGEHDRIDRIGVVSGGGQSHLRDAAAPVHRGTPAQAPNEKLWAALDQENNR